MSIETPPFHVLERSGKRLPLFDFCETREVLFSSPPSFGLVIGTFAAVPYVHLQLEARRRLYPAIPMLVHDDCSPKAGELKELCDEYGAEFEQNMARSPACKGDLSAFAGGLIWAKEQGLDVLVKLSRRFLPMVDWTGSLSLLAVEAQYATYCAWTTSFNFGFRSECVGLSVKEWFEHRLIHEIAQRIIAPGEPFVEGFLHSLARRAAAFNCKAAREYDKRIGPRPSDKDGYAVWDFMGTDRRQRTEHYLWHDWARPEEYYALGKGWGLPYRYEEYVDPNSGFGNRPK